MADRLLFIGWDHPVHGREEHASEIFDECVGHFCALVQDGRIERFEVVILEPALDLGGWFALHGSRQQLDQVRADDEFRRHMTDAGTVVTGLRICPGAVGPGVEEEVTRWREAIHKVPQFA